MAHDEMQFQIPITDQSLGNLLLNSLVSFVRDEEGNRLGSIAMMAAFRDPNEFE